MRSGLCKLCGQEGNLRPQNKVCTSCEENFPEMKQCKSCKRIYPDKEKFIPIENPRCASCVKRLLERKNKTKRLKSKKDAEQVKHMDGEGQELQHMQKHLIIKIGEDIVGKVQLI